LPIVPFFNIGESKNIFEIKTSKYLKYKREEEKNNSLGVLHVNALIKKN
jgi:hypothetical protein